MMRCVLKDLILMIAQIKNKVYILQGGIPNIIRSNFPIVDQENVIYTKDSLGVIFYKMTPINNLPTFYRLNEDLFNMILVSFLNTLNLSYSVYAKLRERYLVYEYIVIRYHEPGYRDLYHLISEKSFSQLRKTTHDGIEINDTELPYEYQANTKQRQKMMDAPIDELNYLKFDKYLAQDIDEIRKSETK